MSSGAAVDRPVLLVLGADAPALLERQLDELSWAKDGLATCSRALPRGLIARPRPRLRAALVATPASLPDRVATVRAWLAEGATSLRCARGAFLGSGRRRQRIGFLFPGQGAPATLGAGALGTAFPEIADVYATADLPASPAKIPAERVQQAIAAASLAGLRAAAALGLDAELAVGHSLGELTALCWAGALDEPALLRATRARGEAMTAHASAAGAMASVIADRVTLNDLIDGTDVVVACENTPVQHVVSGPVEAVEAVVRRARRRRVRALRLPVLGAFHSPLVAGAMPAFSAHLAGAALGCPRRIVVSTVTSRPLAAETDLRALLTRQIVAPVRFVQAIRAASPTVDLFAELGPGRILSGLLSEIDGAPPAVSIRVGERTLDGVLELAGAAHAAGAQLRLERLGGGEAVRTATPGRSL